MKFKETRSRSLRKSIGWRIIAFSNSWMILSFGLTEKAFWNAVIMNLTGVIYFYLYERFWNKIDIGKYSEKSK
jgi:uncharacterized membrane protein|tara:strand:+ start:679 stop:897 length:219 start_codon:yes stop_codon:yes gene_type:complete